MIQFVMAVLATLTNDRYDVMFGFLCRAFLGPTVSSPVMEAVGFGWSATLNAGLLLLVVSSEWTNLANHEFCQSTCVTYIVVAQAGACNILVYVVWVTN